MHMQTGTARCDIISNYSIKSHSYSISFEYTYNILQPFHRQALLEVHWSCDSEIQFVYIRKKPSYNTYQIITDVKHAPLPLQTHHRKCDIEQRRYMYLYCRTSFILNHRVRQRSNFFTDRPQEHCQLFSSHFNSMSIWSASRTFLFD